MASCLSIESKLVAPSTQIEDSVKIESDRYVEVNNW